MSTTQQAPTFTRQAGDRAAPKLLPFAAFFIAHADALSPAEKAQALMEAAEALRADPVTVCSSIIRKALLAKGELIPSTDDTLAYRRAYGYAVRDWVFSVGERGFLAVARELSDAACDLAAKHELCMTHWQWVGDCDHAADAADRAHDRYRGEGSD